MQLNETLIREMVDALALQAAIDEITADLHTAVSEGKEGVTYSDETVTGTDENGPMVNLIRAYFEEQELKTEVYASGEQCGGNAPFTALTISICLSRQWWMKFRY